MGTVGDIATIGIVAGIGYIVWQNWDTISSGFKRKTEETEELTEEPEEQITTTPTPTTKKSTRTLSQTINRLNMIAVSDSPAAPIAKQNAEQLTMFKSALDRIPGFSGLF